MSDLTVDGTAIPLRPRSGLALARQPLFSTARLPGGLLRTAHSAERDRFSSVTLETPPAARATVQSWETVLRVPGRKLFTGPIALWGYVRGISRVETEVLGWSSLRFTVVGSTDTETAFVVLDGGRYRLDDAGPADAWFVKDAEGRWHLNDSDAGAAQIVTDDDGRWVLYG